MFREALKIYGMHCSMSRKGNWDNALPIFNRQRG
jgi:hypothetical protein